MAVLAAALPYGLSPALADDKQAEKVEPPSKPIEVKAVPVILLPPADDSVFAFKPSRPPAAGQAAPPADDPAFALSASRPAIAGQIISVPPSEDPSAAFKPSPRPASAGSVASVPPAGDPAAASKPLPRPASAGPVASVSPADKAAVAPSRPEPTKIRELAQPVEPPALPAQPPQTASQAPAGNAASASLRPEPAKIRKTATSFATPSLPERRPFRPILDQVDPREKEQNAAYFSAESRAPKSFFAKVNSAFQPLTNLWPGNKRVANADAPVAEAKSAGVASPAPAGPGPEGGSADVKQESGSFLKKLRFW